MDHLFSFSPGLAASQGVRDSDQARVMVAGPPTLVLVTPILSPHRHPFLDLPPEGDTGEGAPPLLGGSKEGTRDCWAHFPP